MDSKLPALLVSALLCGCANQRDVTQLTYETRYAASDIARLSARMNALEAALQGHDVKIGAVDSQVKLQEKKLNDVACQLFNSGAVALDGKRVNIFSPSSPGHPTIVPHCPWRGE